MKDNYTREIDLLDLFINWLAHWRSLLVCMLVGVVLACGYMYIGRNSVKEEVIEQNVLDTIPAGATLSTLTAEQLNALSVEDMESRFLSETDINAVDQVISLYNEYNENFEAYETEKKSMKLKEKSDLLCSLANSKNIIDSDRNTLTPDQQIYYYAKTEQNSADEKTTENSGVISVVVTSGGASTKLAILIVILAFILHFLVVACRYIFNDKVKHVDDLSAMVNVPEYTRMIDWEKVDSKKGLDKLVNRFRFAGIRKTSLAELVEINASATVEKLKNKDYSSVALVGTNLADERDMLAAQISKANANATVKSIDSITHSVNGADDIAGVDAAILAVKVACTRYNDFFEELQSLRDRDVDVIGIAIFE